MGSDSGPDALADVIGPRRLPPARPYEVGVTYAKVAELVHRVRLRASLVEQRRESLPRSWAATLYLLDLDRIGARLKECEGLVTKLRKRPTTNAYGAALQRVALLCAELDEAEASYQGAADSYASHGPLFAA